MAVVFLFPSLAAADVNNFIVDNFTADYYLTRGNPQGEMRIVEKIQVTFTDQNHGILRSLPMFYKNLPLDIHVNKISSETGAPSQYTVTTQGTNEVLKIGDPNQTVTGAQEYTIDYTVQHVITFYADHDELYWDINGDQWQQLFTAVTGVIHLPAGLELSQRPICYAGFYGERNNRCSVDAMGSTITVKGTQLLGSETVTLVAGFHKGYFHAPGISDYVLAYSKYALEFLVPFLLIGGSGFVWWFKRGRDAKGTGVIIPQYDVPDNLRPIEVGALLHFTAGNRELTATLIDLAIRGYVKIIEEDKELVLFPKRKLFSLQLVNKDWSGLNPWEASLIASVFGSDASSEKVELFKPVGNASLSGPRTAFDSIKKSVDASLADRGYFVSNPYRFLAVPFVLIIFAVWIFTPTFGGLFSITNPIGVGVIAGIVVLAIFYHFMPARSALGVVAKEHILGLKLYLEVAEKERIRKLQSPNAPYAAQSNAPVQTVELFEKLLPYAIVLGVEKQWAKQFENLYTAPPRWYGGNLAAFNTGYLVGSLGGGFGAAVGTSFGASGSSSGSGFGGGGFAGGGGGGGGGGGW